MLATKYGSREELIRGLRGVRQVVINSCHGGFGLSHEAIVAYFNKCGTPVWIETGKNPWVPFNYYLVPPEERISSDPDNWHSMTVAQRQAHNAAVSQTAFYDRNIARDDPYLVQVIQELGAAANGRHAELKVVEIPAEVDWEIEEYDGSEWVSEKHRTWK